MAQYSWWHITMRGAQLRATAGCALPQHCHGDFTSQGQPHSPGTVTMRQNPSVELLAREPSFLSPSLPHGSQPRPWWAAKGTPIPLQSWLGARSSFVGHLAGPCKAREHENAAHPLGRGFWWCWGFHSASQASSPLGLEPRGLCCFHQGWEHRAWPGSRRDKHTENTAGAELSGFEQQ